MTPPIAILGAGPSGLALGRLLERANIDFMVYERDTSATSAWGRGGSGTLDLHEGTGLLALEEAGLLDQFKAIARYDVPFIVADMHGKVHVTLGEGEVSDRPEIDRRDLRTMLLKSVSAERIRWGTKVQGVQKDADGSVSVHFADGKVESGFRLIVGADGAWSKARSVITSSKPQFAGKYYLSTNISPLNPFYPTVASMVGKGNYMGLGGKQMIGAMKLGDDSYYVMAALRLPENWKTENVALLEDTAKLRQVLVREHFNSRPRIQTDLIEQSDGDFYAWPLYGLPAETLGWETVPGVTLVGDAAHICPPNGEGVNVALHDSLQLAQQIIKFGVEGLHEAVEAYEKLMLPRAKATIDDSKIMDGLMFAEDAPTGLLNMFEAMGGSVNA